MLTHEQIMAAMLLPISSGEVVSAHEKQPKLIFTPRSIAPEYANLFSAAPVLYKTIDRQQEALQALIEAVEQIGLDGIVPALLDMQCALVRAKRYAVEGIEAVSRDLLNGAG